jgi:hypothetical protein
MIKDAIANFARDGDLELFQPQPPRKYAGSQKLRAMSCVGTEFDHP